MQLISGRLGGGRGVLLQFYDISCVFILFSYFNTLLLYVYYHSFVITILYYYFKPLIYVFSVFCV